MKKIYNILLVLVAGLSLTACTSEVDDLFDKSSAERIQEAMAADNQLLVSAPNGWLMEYYGSSTYGGYNMFVKFNADNTVTAVNEMYGGDQSTTSHYKLEQSKGVILSFDEYSEIFHFFSEPANALGWGDNGKGMLGDFEFRVLEATADRFVLQGKKHGAKIIMTRVAEGTDWAKYLNDVAEVEKNIVYKKYQIMLNGQDPVVLSGNGYRAFSYHDAETDKDVLVPYIVTPECVKFNKPIQIGETTIESMTYAGDGNWNTNTGVSIHYIQPSLTEQLTDPNAYWSFKKNKMSSLAVKYFSYAEKASANEGEEILFMALGLNPNSPNNTWGLYFSSNGNGAAYRGIISLNVTVLDDNHIQLSGRSAYDSNGQYYYGKGYNYVSNGILYDSFELSTDDIKNPSYIRMTATSRNIGEYVDVFPGLDYWNR